MNVMHFEMIVVITYDKIFFPFSYICVFFCSRVTLGNCVGLGERPYRPPWWGQLAWFIVFVAMLLVAVLGNTLVIWIVLGKFFLHSFA